MWLAPVSLMVALLVSIIFTWAYYFTADPDHAMNVGRNEHNAWGWGWSELNALTLLYTLMLLLALLLSAAIIALRLRPDFGLRRHFSRSGRGERFSSRS